MVVTVTACVAPHEHAIVVLTPPRVERYSIGL